MNAISWDKFVEKKKEIEEQTGFVCYDTPQQQTVWYGTSDKLAAFKPLVEPFAETGTMVITMDDGASYFWSEFKKQWY